MKAAESSVTPLSKPISFMAIWPWSWNMVNGVELPARARTNTVSDG